MTAVEKPLRVFKVVGINCFEGEKLKFFITKNTKYNLRELSRALNKNDAYLQQYFHRGKVLTV